MQNRPRLHRLLGTARLTLTTAVALTAGGGLAWLLLMSRVPVRADRWVQVLLAGAALLAMTWSAFHCVRHWSRPAARLTEMLPLVRIGELPIDELAKVGGGLRQVVPIIQELLRDLKQQRAQVGHLHEEIRQRVAHRTDALERLVGSLRQQATKDPLTGLYNRRMLDQHLAKVIERCREDGSNLCLLMIDVDHFKQLNDTRGHAQGDEFLKATAQLIRSTIREQDVAFRCGGDEFLILLPACDERNAQAIADRLSSLVDQMGKTMKVAKPPGLSIGLCMMPCESAQTPDDLLTTADQNLYAVKKARKRDKPPASPARLSA